MLTTFENRQWNEVFSQENQKVAIDSLESGQVLFFPNLPFTLSNDEKTFLTPTIADPKSKKIGYHPETNRLWGVHQQDDEARLQLKRMMQRYAQYALTLVQQTLPHYRSSLIVGRTSYRPVEVIGRHSSYRKDDKRLHVDAFPSSPNQGKRILRVFCNINPDGQSRVWRLGEPFENVAQRFLPTTKKAWPGKSFLIFMIISKLVGKSILWDLVVNLATLQLNTLVQVLQQWRGLNPLQSLEPKSSFRNNYQSLLEF